MPIFYSDTELSRLTKLDFHREVKPFIIADAARGEVNFLKKVKAQNPDIGIEDNIIYLRNPKDHRIIIKTDLEFNSYFY